MSQEAPLLRIDNDDVGVVVIGAESEKVPLGKVCIVGSGVSGISAARVLLAEGVDCTVFEKSDNLGGVWASNYANYGVQTPGDLYEFPDEPFPEGTHQFPSGPTMIEYIENYAQKHGVTKAVKLNCGVARIGSHTAPPGESPATRWEVETITAEGSRETHVFDYILCASGVYSQVSKYIPDFDGMASFKGVQCHSVDFKDLSVCKEKRVVTVGYGKSAMECSMWPVREGGAAKSTILFRETHWPVPRKILGLIPFEYATFNRFGAAILLPSYPIVGPLEWVLHKIPGLLTFVWWLVAQIFSLQLGLGKLKPKLGFIDDFWGGHGILPDPEFFPMVNKGEIDAKQGEIKEVHATAVELKSGEQIPADVLVFATGFKRDFGFMPPEIRALTDEDGLWLYRNMVHPDFPNLVFLNSNTTTFTNITTAGIQARWFYEVFSQNLLPSREEMCKAIEEQKAWKRATMPNAGPSRAYMVQTHQVHYYDELLKDMGASIRRKRGCCAGLKEFADPYRSRDYDTIVTGEFKTRAGESAPPGKRQWSFCWEFSLFLLWVSLAVFVGLCATHAKAWIAELEV